MEISPVPCQRTTCRSEDSSPSQLRSHAVTSHLAYHRYMCFSPRLALAVLLISPGALAQTSGQSASTPPKRAKASASSATSTLDAGAVSNNVYHNKSLALTCRIPDGWVLRTDELNARDDDKTRDAKGNPAQPDTPPASSTGAKVRLSRVLPSARSQSRRREFLHPHRRRKCLGLSRID